MEDDGKIWVDCWHCGGEGYIDGDCTCGEDCCCCLEPEPPVCNICRGKGGYQVPIDSDAARDALGLAPKS